MKYTFLKDFDNLVPFYDRIIWTIFILPKLCFFILKVLSASLLSVCLRHKFSFYITWIFVNIIFIFFSFTFHAIKWLKPILLDICFSYFLNSPELHPWLSDSFSSTLSWWFLVSWSKIVGIVFFEDELQFIFRYCSSPV